MKRGDVIMVDWPYSDRTGSKIRPALVAQSDFLNSLIADTVLLAITRTARGAASTEVVVDPGVEPQSGLRYRSVVSCNNFLTIDQALVGRTIGQVSLGLLQEVNNRLKTALELP